MNKKYCIGLWMSSFMPLLSCSCFSAFSAISFQHWLWLIFNSSSSLSSVIPRMTIIGAMGDVI